MDDMVDSMSRQRRPQNHHHALQKLHNQNGFAALLLILVIFGITTAHAYNQELRTKIASSIAKGERRALERSRNDRRILCDQCQRPPIQCVCDCLPSAKIRTDVNIIVLQHPTEFRRSTFSTVPLLKLVLENIQICVGHNFDDTHPVLEKLFAQNKEKPMLLFPGPDASTLDDPSIQQQFLRTTPSSNDNDLATKSTLILIDGTWTQAARMARHSPILLEKCKQVQFASVDNPSIYDAIRKEPEAHCLSTLEACAKALTLLDPSNGLEASNYLHASLQSLVRQQLLHTSRAPRYNNRAQKKGCNPERRERIEQIEQKLFSSKSDGGGAENTIYNKKTFSYRSSRFNDLAKEEKQKRISEIEHDLFETEKDDDEGRSTNVNSVAKTFIPKIRRLRRSDATLIDSRWPYRSKKSLKMIHRCLEADPDCCLGIDGGNNMTLCAFILRYDQSGALGMLHVDDIVQRRGYGSRLLQRATQVLQEREEDCVAYILEGNVASERLFEGQGWVRENPNLKKQSGRRRAKRKWIKPMLPMKKKCDDAANGVDSNS